jgi:excisionase family DNA binding protein
MLLVIFRLANTQTQASMSTNIRVIKTCEYCNKKFEAKTLHTRYCSHICNSRHYKQIARNKKIKTAVAKEAVKPKAQLLTPIDYSSIQIKELLTIREACALLNITHVTLRRWLKSNLLTSSRIGKKHLIKRSEINQYL